MGVWLIGKTGVPILFSISEAIMADTHGNVKSFFLIFLKKAHYLNEKLLFLIMFISLKGGANPVNSNMWPTASHRLLLNTQWMPLSNTSKGAHRR